MGSIVLGESVDDNENIFPSTAAVFHFDEKNAFLTRKHMARFPIEILK